MAAAEEKITEAELEVMEVLWDAGEPVTLGQIREALADRNGETVKLFTHSDSCFIEIEDCRHNRFYLSRKRPEETNELYDAILSRLSEK